MSKKKIGNGLIEFSHFQESRIWIHSNYLGYGKWIYNNELEKLIDVRQKPK